MSFIASFGLHCYIGIGDLYSQPHTEGNIPRQCSCGVQNDNDHLLICRKGGYVHIRHDALVQVEAEIMREAGCKDVAIEQHLIHTKADLL